MSKLTGPALWKRFFQERRWFESLVNSRNQVFLKFSEPGHFYSPIPDLDEVDRRGAQLFDTTPTSLPGIDINRAAQVELVTRFAEHHDALPFADEPQDDLRFGYHNLFFGFGDAVVACAMLRSFPVQRVVEVGSGYSSALMLDTNDRFLDHRVHFTFIEPYPDRLHGLLQERDKQTTQIECRSVQDVEDKVFDQLERDDILFIDSSHVVKAGSDVAHLFFHVLPRLKPGVFVHVHDILWPFEYPQAWLEGGRAWNEAYLLRSFLQYNDMFEIVYFNHYMALHETALLKEKLPTALRLSPEGIPANSSIWLRRRG